MSERLRMPRHTVEPGWRGRCICVLQRTADQYKISPPPGGIIVVASHDKARCGVQTQQTVHGGQNRRCKRVRVLWNFA